MTYPVRIQSAASFGLAVQQARLIAGISQRDLAKRIGTSQRYIWELEAGKDSTLLRNLISALTETGASITVEIPESNDE